MKLCCNTAAALELHRMRRLLTGGNDVNGCLSDSNASCCSHQPMMDRTKAAELPKLQCGFIDFVCTFVYKVLFNVALCLMTCT